MNTSSMILLLTDVIYGVNQKILLITMKPKFSFRKMLPIHGLEITKMSKRWNGLLVKYTNGGT